MLKMSKVLVLISLCHQTISDSCIPPNVSDGDVHGDKSGDSWTGQVICHPGFTLVGSNKLKCRTGVWSSNIPVCTAIGQCNPEQLPDVAYAKKFAYKKSTYRGSVFKYSCRKGFKIYGKSLVHCTGESWSLNNLPICAKSGCDESLVKQVLYGESKRKAHGSIYMFRCDDGSVLHGSPKLVCNGQNWNDSAPMCASPALPPSITVEGATAVNNELIAGAEVTLKCKPEGGNPTPTLTVSIGENEVAYSQEPDGVTHTFIAQKEHNTALVTCMAVNMAMEEPVASDTVLNIKFGPQQLSLGGPDSLVQGHSVGYECVSSSSNPPAEIHLDLTDQDRRNINQMLKITDSTTSWTGSGWETTSTVIVNSEPGVTSLSLTCSSVSYDTQKTITKIKQIGVKFAPEKVTISGPQTVVLGSKIKLQCSSSPSVPASSLTWSVSRGKEKNDYSSEVEVDQLSDGSFISRSGLELEASSGSDIAVECYANNQVLGNDFIAYAHIIEILSPPGNPLISRVVPLTETDGNQELICSSSPSGHPPARLIWYDSAGMVNSQYTIEEDHVSAKITFVPNLMDRELTCEVSNSALTEPIRNTIKIEPPEVTTTTSTSTSTDTTTASSEKHTAFEYDQEEEDDQLDYEDMYPNTEGTTDKTLTQSTLNIPSKLSNIELINEQNKEVTVPSTTEGATDKAGTKLELKYTEKIIEESKGTTTDKETVTSDSVSKSSKKENLIQTEKPEVQKSGKQMLQSEKSSEATSMSFSETVEKSVKSDETLIRNEKQIMNGSIMLHCSTGLLILIFSAKYFTHKSAL